ncbi:DUF4158 domain-containing protein, partial [Salmonella enterica]
AFGNDREVPAHVVQWVARQVRANPDMWGDYAQRDTTRREHLQELRSYLSVRPFGLADYRFLVHQMTDLATQTDKPIVLAANALQQLR